MDGHSEEVSFIRSVAGLQRGCGKASVYGKVILPLATPMSNTVGGLSERAEPCIRGVSPEPVADLGDSGDVPVKVGAPTYFEHEVLPYALAAWIDPDKTRGGYEIPFTGHFHKFEPPRPRAEIDADCVKIQEIPLEITA